MSRGAFKHSLCDLAYITMAADADFASVWDMACHSLACRDLQQALDVCTDPGRFAIAEALKSHVWHCIRCRNANHVLQKVITVLRPNNVQFVIDEIMEHPSGALLASKHPYGCRIVERLIEHCRSDQLRPLIAELLKDVLNLSSHRFGNFVVQHIMEFGTSGQKHSIATTIMDGMGKMQRPFPLYVFERVLSQGLVEDRIRLRLELLGHHPQIISKTSTSRRREDMPHLMLLGHAKQRLDRLGEAPSRATVEKATKRECTWFVGRGEAQRRGTIHLHSLVWKLPSVDVSDSATSARANGSESSRDYVSGYCCMCDPGRRGGGGAPGAQKIPQEEDLA